MVDDGRCSGDGHWSGYLAYTRHPAVGLALAPYHLGSSDEDATHWLLIDRQERRAYVAPEAEARRVLHEQWPAAEAVLLSEDEVQALMDRLEAEFRARPLPSMEQITAAMEAQRRLEEEMVDWLDQTPQAREGLEAIRRMVEGGTA